MPERKEIRIGVAGLGFGAAVHVPGFQSLSAQRPRPGTWRLPEIKVVVLAGSTQERAQCRAQKLGIEASCAGT